jgi:hypothetical protein
MFIKKQGISGARVVSTNLSSVGIYATPTLLLVDSSGTIRSEWVGKQDEPGQQKVLFALLPQSGPAAPHS